MKLFIVLIAISVAGCSDSERKKSETIQPPDKKTYEETVLDYLSHNPSHNKSFLQFDLGASVQVAKTHLDSLIASGKIGADTTFELKDSNTRIEGYPYEISLTKDSIYQTLLSLHYKGDSLYSISILPYTRFGEAGVKDFLDRQYGLPKYVEYDSVRSDYRYCWFKNDYEISYIPAPFRPITIVDLRMKSKEPANGKGSISN
jgi:hypothetical protein